MVYTTITIVNILFGYLLYHWKNMVLIYTKALSETLFALGMDGNHLIFLPCVSVGKLTVLIIVLPAHMEVSPHYDTMVCMISLLHYWRRCALMSVGAAFTATIWWSFSLQDSVNWWECSFGCGGRGAQEISRSKSIVWYQTHQSSLSNIPTTVIIL